MKQSGGQEAKRISLDTVSATPPVAGFGLVVAVGRVAGKAHCTQLRCDTEPRRVDASRKVARR